SPGSRRSWRSNRSTSEKRLSSPRPYPPTATTVKSGSRSEAISRIALSSVEVRRVHTSSPPAPTRSPRRACRHSRNSRRGPGVSDSLGAALTGAYPHHLFDRQDGDLAVADLARGGGSLDGAHRRPGQVVGDEDLDPHLRHERHLVLGAPVHLGVAGLATEAGDVVDGHARHADRLESITDVLELERLDVGDDQLHFPILSA